MKELKSLKSIFKDCVFRIPDYQRGYAWKDEQLTQFWEDILNLNDDRYHYTGVLSLKEVDKKTWSNWSDERWLIEERDCVPYHIVDGQQRLTTFVIFIQAIIEIVENLPENKGKSDDDIYLGTYKLKDIKEDYLVISKPPHFLINTYKFGYESDNPSFHFMRHRIFNEPHSGTVSETFYTLNLENAKHFFIENIKAYMLKEGVEVLETVFKQVTQRLMFNVFEIGGDFDVYVAFETMNNRGKRLSNLELLKNRLIYLTTLYDKKQIDADDRDALRNKINDAWKEAYHQLGRNKKSPLNDDDFLVAHWIMYFKYTREKGDDYIKFLLNKQFTPEGVFTKKAVLVKHIEAVEEIRENTEIDDDDAEDEIVEETTIMVSKLTPQNIEEYVNSLKSSAVHWYNTWNPDTSTEEGIWIDRLNRIGMMYFRPLITASYLAPGVDEQQRIRLFKAIERFIFLAFRLSRAFSTFRNSEFYKAARELRSGEITIDTIIHNLHHQLKWTHFDKGNGEFDYEYFKKYMDKKFNSGGGYYNWNGLRYFLFEYEFSLYSTRGNVKITTDNFFKKPDRDKVSIEHIYPQTPKDEYWINHFVQWNEDEKKIFNGTLGNLVPLSLSINSSLQNDSFDDKKNPKYDVNGEKIREGYSNGSHSEIEIASKQQWTADEIKERGIALLKFMEQRWNIKLGDDQTKLKILHLDILFNKEIEDAK